MSIFLLNSWEYIICPWSSEHIDKFSLLNLSSQIYNLKTAQASNIFQDQIL
jgi:hypothetical protein